MQNLRQKFILLSIVSIPLAWYFFKPQEPALFSELIGPASATVMPVPDLTTLNLADFARNGGTLVTFSVIGGGMQEIFGFENSIEVPAQSSLVFTRDAFTSSFVQSSAEGTGHAYAIGNDFGHFILRAHNGRLNKRADTYVNAYQPKVDALLRFLAAVYQQGESNPILLSPTPDAKAVTVLMTHDIDFVVSLDNIPLYAEVEKAANVTATYFIQTKYVKDYSEDAFFTPARIFDIQKLIAMGM